MSICIIYKVYIILCSSTLFLYDMIQTIRLTLIFTKSRYRLYRITSIICVQIKNQILYNIFCVNYFNDLISLGFEYK